MRKILFYALVLLSIAVSGEVFRYMNRHDNSFRAGSSISVTEGLLRKQNLISLANGWEFFRGEILTPEQIKRGEFAVPRLSVSVGSSSNFSFGDRAAPKDGSATYRLVFAAVPDMIMALFIPSIYTSSRIFLNGEQIADHGLLQKRTDLSQTVHSFKTLERNEIVINAFNKRDYYSGLAYVPFLTTPVNEELITQSRFGSYALLCCIAFIFMVGAFAVWFGTRQNKDLYFALICLSYLCYCLKELLCQIPGMSVPVVFQFMRCLGFECIKIFVVAMLADIALRNKNRVIYGFVLACACAGVVIHLLIFAFHPLRVNDFVLWLNGEGGAIFGTVIIAYCLYKMENTIVAVGGVVYLSSLVFSNIMPPHHPIYFVKTTELAGLILIICLAIKLFADYIRTGRENTKVIADLRKQRQMLSYIAHDLKAPANAITGYLELIGDVYRDDHAKKTEIIGKIETNSSDIVNRVNNLQTVADYLEIPIRRENFSLNALLCEIAEVYRFRFPKLAVNTEVPREGVNVFADKARLRVAVENIFENCAAHARASVNVVLSQEKGGAKITLADDGAGVPDDMLPHLFNKFFTDGAESKNKGKGLAISKMIIDEHGGKISAENIRKDGEVRTIFTIFLS